MNLTLIISGVVALLAGYGLVKLKSAHREIEALTKTNTDLQIRKTAAETQVKNAKVRQKNEENMVGADRGGLIERMQKSGDLRD